ncbi:11415_t:CDS:1, partial [Paraglomus brasilianum]
RFKFQKRILAQIFGEMACNSLHYGVLSNYDDTWFLHRPENESTTLYISRVVHPASRCPTLRQCVYYISRLALNDVVGTRLDPDPDSRISIGPDTQEESVTSGDDNSDDSDYDPKETRKRAKKLLSRQTNKKMRVSVKDHKSESKIDKYISDGGFAKVFSGVYHDQAVAWKICESYKEQEKVAALTNKSHIYSILEKYQ